MNEFLAFLYNSIFLHFHEFEKIGGIWLKMTFIEVYKHQQPLVDCGLVGVHRPPYINPHSAATRASSLPGGRAAIVWAAAWA